MISKRKKHDRHRWAVLYGKRLETFHLAIQRMCKVKTRELRNRNLEMVSFICSIRNGKQCGPNAGTCLPYSLHCGKFCWLMLEGIHPVEIPKNHLKWDQKGQQPKRHRKHNSAFGYGFAAPDRVCPDADYDQCCRDIKPRHRVPQPIWKRRVEDDGPPVRGEVAAVNDLVPGRRLHPAVDCQDPERREQRAERHHERREEIEWLRNQSPARIEARPEMRLQERTRSDPHMQKVARAHWLWHRQSGSSLSRTETALRSL